MHFSSVLRRVSLTIPFRLHGQMAFFALQAAAAAPSVTIANGVVIGTTTNYATPTPGTADITKYVGIPFASSPPLRFGPPEAAPSWAQPLTATATMPACIQQFNDPASTQQMDEALFNNPGLPPLAESEDCLYLNIYVPPGTKSGAGKAVMFWIYGGNLAFGTGGLGQYDGSSFAYNQDVVVVTHNYRTSVFGFPGSPDLLPPEQNPGFLDQRAALAWVQTNIAAFGGDPSRVTIFGESAGGYSVKNLLALPPSPLNFRGAIMESEASVSSTVFTPTLLDPGLDSNGDSWDELVIALNCTTTDPQINCVREVPAATIKSVIEENGFGYFPVADYITHVSNVAPAFQDGTAAKVPFIIGTNLDEGRVFAYLYGLDNNSTDQTVTQALTEILPNSPALVVALAAALDTQDAYEAVSTVITQETFLCPASLLARLAQQEGYTVFRYLFSAAFPNQALFPDPGVYHTAEIPIVFGTYFLEDSYGPATTQQINLSKYVQTAWANFAKEPTTGPGEGWPEYGAAGYVFDIGSGRSSEGTTITAASIDGSCLLYDAIIKSEGL